MKQYEGHHHNVNVKIYTYKQKSKNINSREKKHNKGMAWGFKGECILGCFFNNMTETILYVGWRFSINNNSSLLTVVPLPPT